MVSYFLWKYRILGFFFASLLTEMYQYISREFTEN